MVRRFSSVTQKARGFWRSSCIMASMRRSTRVGVCSWRSTGPAGSPPMSWGLRGVRASPSQRSPLVTDIVRLRLPVRQPGPARLAASYWRGRRAPLERRDAHSPDGLGPMTDPALAADFPRPTEEDWLRLVDKAIKGGDFERRLVSRTADGLRIEPLYTRTDAVPAATTLAPGAAPLVRGQRSPESSGWDIRQICAEPDPVAANTAILEDLAGGTTSVLLQIAAPGWSGVGYEQAVMARALQGVMLDVAPISLVAGEYTPDAAGSLIALWRAGRRRRDPAARRLQLRSARHAGARPARSTIPCRKRSRSPPDLVRTTAAHARRDSAPRQRSRLAPGRRHRGAGAGARAGLARRLPARGRGGRHRARRSAAEDRGDARGRCRPIPDDRQAPRRPPRSSGASRTRAARRRGGAASRSRPRRRPA